LLIWRSCSEVPPTWGASALTIGKFDGVHKGHVTLVNEVLLSASHRDYASVVVTFDRHPSEIVNSSTAPRQICSLDSRLSLLSKTGVDAVLVLPFTSELAAMSPRTFVGDILVGVLGAREIVVGPDFRFGARKSGDSEMLSMLGREFDFSVNVVDGLLDSQGIRYSSSRIRDAISLGNQDIVSDALGCWNPAFARAAMSLQR
jgi:riboflavin kinase/FMN adenylyltransferase